METYNLSYYMCYSDHLCKEECCISGVSLECQALHFPQLHSLKETNQKQAWLKTNISSRGVARYSPIHWAMLLMGEALQYFYYMVEVTAVITKRPFTI